MHTTSTILPHFCTKNGNNELISRGNEIDKFVPTIDRTPKRVLFAAAGNKLINRVKIPFFYIRMKFCAPKFILSKLETVRSLLLRSTVHRISSLLVLLQRVHTAARLQRIHAN